MFDTASASNGVKLALLEGQLLTREIDRATFIERATNLGLPAPAIGDAADKFMAIAANQAARRATLRSSYDYIVIGSGASGSVVARRLAENQDAQVLLLEAGGEDLKPGILIPETWFFNQGGEFDWNFAAERSPSVNNRSIAQAMGKAIGGGTSINGMVWARGHKNDFDHWAKEAGDDAWNYRHVLDIYRRIEDWHGVPDLQRRGSGGEVFVQPAPNPSSIAPAFLRAAESLSIPTFADQNGVMQEGSGGAAITNVRIRDGRRLNIPSSYLYPVMDQANLTVLTAAYVNRLTIEGNTVTGVTVQVGWCMDMAPSLAKMGQDDLSVVDAQLRVYGVKKLRIADGSIMPTITTGNTHAPCVIIGERLAEILNADPTDPRGAARQRRRLAFPQKEILQ
jgi:choline dehydrogenase